MPNWPDGSWLREKREARAYRVSGNKIKPIRADKPPLLAFLMRENYAIVYICQSCKIFRYLSSLAFTYPARSFSIAEGPCFAWYSSKAL